MLFRQIKIHLFLVQGICDAYRETELQATEESETAERQVRALKRHITQRHVTQRSVRHYMTTQVLSNCSLRGRQFTLYDDDYVRCSLLVNLSLFQMRQNIVEFRSVSDFSFRF